MGNNYFRFKQFTLIQKESAFKVGTDGVLLGARADIACAASILDIGTGTGLIGLMLAQRSTARIVCIEPDKASFREACENVRRSIWRDRIVLENTDLQNYFPGNSFDLIVTNPPYFAGSLLNPDKRKAATRHSVTLSGEELLNGVTRLLAPKGKFEVIFPCNQGIAFTGKAQDRGLYCNKILKIRPLPGSEIKRIILTFSRQSSSVQEEFLTIERGKRHDFTDEYINLTRDFYQGF